MRLLRFLTTPIVLVLLAGSTYAQTVPESSRPPSLSKKQAATNGAAIRRAFTKRMARDYCDPHYCQDDTDCDGTDACGTCWAGICGPPGPTLTLQQKPRRK